MAASASRRSRSWPPSCWGPPSTRCGATPTAGVPSTWQAYGIPVLIRYHTRFPDANGVMREYADVYGRSPVYAADYPAAGVPWPAPSIKAEGPATEGPL